MTQVSRRKQLLLAILLCLSYLTVFMQRTGPGVISDQLQHQFHLTAAVLGTMSSIQYFLYMFLQIPVGLSGDKFGPHRLFVTGVLLDGVGTIVFSLAPSFSLLLVGRGLVGLGDSLIWVNIVLLISKRFAGADFGKLLGIVTIAGNLGALLTTVPFALWVANVGWSKPFLILGTLLVVIAILNYFAFREPKNLTSNSIELASAAHMSKPKKQEPVLRVLQQVICHRLSWATFFTHFGAVGTYIGFTGLWAVPYFMDTYTLSRADATVLTMTAFLGAIVGGPLAGMWTDRLGQRRTPYVFFQCLTTVAWLMTPLFAGKPPLAIAYASMFILGMGSGASLLTFAVIRAEIPGERTGVTSGFANTGGFLSAVLLPILFGFIIDVTSGTHVSTPSAHSFALAFCVPAAFSFVGVIGSLLIREQRAEAQKNRATSGV